MKMEKLAIFAKENLRINILKIKNIVKAGTIAIIEVNIEVMHTIHVI